MVPQERSKSDLGSKAFPERFLVPPSYAFLVGFWRHLGDFGRLLGTSWAPRGSQNRPFWYEDAPKCRKMRSKMRHQKKYEFLIKFRSENVRFWMGWTHPNALYISIWVVFADYDKIENFMKIDAQMVPKSHPKIDIWAIRASTFEVLGGFGRVLIFDEFWDGQKVDQKWQKCDQVRPKGKVFQSFRRPGGMSGGAGGSFRGVRNTSKTCEV